MNGLAQFPSRHSIAFSKFIADSFSLSRLNRCNHYCYRYLISLSSYSTTATATSKSAPSQNDKNISILGKDYNTDEFFNISPSILEKVGRSLHRQPYHPLNLISEKIKEYASGVGYELQKSFLPPNESSISPNPYYIEEFANPIVSTYDNFDSILVPKDHPSRSKQDTYYLNSDTVLRTHTTAHEISLLSLHDAFVTIGDVYRKDEIDSVHYPVFHQVEIVRRLSPQELGLMQSHFKQNIGNSIGGKSTDRDCYLLGRDGIQERHGPDDVEAAVRAMKRVIEGLIGHIFGPKATLYWIKDEFPFTNPSYQLEMDYQGKRLELLGCGILKREMLKLARNNMEDKSIAWAVGFGLERLAMILYQIPDIRLFWSTDSRFLDQFRPNNNIMPSSSLQNQQQQKVKFRPFSKFPANLRDISFWLPDEQHSKDSYQNPIPFNDLCEQIREEAGDIVEKVTLLDSFRHPKTNKVSHCYRICYRSMTRGLKDAELIDVHERVRNRLVKAFSVTLR